MYTECRIQWVDDLSEMDVVISDMDDDIENPDDNDEDVFFYGMSREQILQCFQNNEICEGEWKIIAVYDVNQTEV